MFTHLHLHTEYSLLDGLSKIGELMETAKTMGMKSMAITDHGTMYGVIEFYKAAKAAEIKPILGLEAYISKTDHKIKEKSDGKFKEINHLTLLAKNNEGYKNLMKLTSIAHLEGFYYKPRFDKETLKKHSEGLICLSGCMASELSEYILADEHERAENLIKWYLEVFGMDNFYLEIQRHRYKDFTEDAVDDSIEADLHDMQQKEDKMNKGLIAYSKQFGIPLVATNDTHYIKPEQAVVQDALVCIQTGKQVSELKRMRTVDAPTFYLTSPEEMKKLFQDLPEAVLNTNKIADACNVDIVLGEWYFPKFEIPDGKTAGDYLREIAYEGAISRFGELSDVVKTRLDYELGVIEQRGYSPYFLIMGDMVRFCTESRIVTTTRGSAAGCLVLFCIGITQVDPLRYQLPFERFLNPFRPSPPDIDLDIADNRRVDLINYLASKYGSDMVAQICTFGRMMARGSVRDIGRVLGYPYSFPDQLAKTIPQGSQGFPMSIKKALSVSPELKEIYDTNADAKKIIDLAKQIEGNARHTSVHAAAVVIAPSTMTNFSPLQKESGGERIITQYEMHAAEEVGLIKFDVLGIRNLAILNSAVDIIKQETGTDIDIKKIPLDDKKTYEMLARGETMGTFQLGGTGMTRYLVELKPERVEDLMAMVALFRPGPMANIPEYIKRKNDPSAIHYMHPKMKNFLEASYGILVYQEDILFTALELAGYNWGEVDKLRKAIGKKNPEEMKKQEQIFKDGCVSISGMTKKEADDLWDLFVPFQGYGFNKAHAAAYGLVAYQTSYLKANYPVEYMTAVLTAESGNTEKITEGIEECKRMGIAVLPPDVNESGSDFTIVEDRDAKYGKTIRFGLSAIKNVGEAAVVSIQEKRKEIGKFTSLSHLLFHVDTRKVNKKVLESLIKVGAMDAFGKRAALLAGIDVIREKTAEAAKKHSSGQVGLFDTSEDNKVEQFNDPLPNVPELPKAELLNFEKELLGFYLTEHPMAGALSTIRDQVSYKLSELDATLHGGRTSTLGGIITAIRPIYTKKNNKLMAFATLEDESGKLDLVFFPKIWDEVKERVKADYPYILTGKLDKREDSLNMLVEKIRPVNIEVLESESKAVLTIKIPRGTDKSKLQQIGQILKSSPGDESIDILIPNGTSGEKRLSLPYTVTLTPEIKKQIAALLKP